MTTLRSIRVACAIALSLAVSMASAAEPHPALVDAEAVYRSEGAEAALPLFEELAIRFDSQRQAADQSTALHFIGECHWRLGNYDEARRFLDRARVMRDELGDSYAVGKTLNVLGLLEWDLGNYDQAIARFGEASAAGKAAGDSRLEGASLNNLSLVYDELGEYDTSLEQYQTVLDIYSGVDFPRGEGDTYGNIGGVYLLLGRYRDALKYYEKALAISESLGSKPSMSQDLGNIGLARHGLGEIDTAIDAFDRAIELAGDAGMRQDIAYWQRARGNAMISMGRYDAGLDLHRASLAEYEKIGARTELLGALHDMGNLHLSLGDPATAEQYYAEATRLARTLGHANGITINLLAQGKLELRRGAFEDAEAFFGQAIARATESGARGHAIDGLIGQAYALQGMSEYASAARSAQRALDIATATGARHERAESQFALGENSRLTGHAADALEMFGRAEATLLDTADPDLMWQIEFSRGRALRSLGDVEAAAAALTRSVELIEEVRTRLLEERYRSGYLQDKQQVYIELVRMMLELDRADAAFEMAERLRARSYFQQFELSSPLPPSANNPEREQELRERVRQLQRALGEERASGNSRQAAVTTFSVELLTAEREYQAFLDDQLSRNIVPSLTQQSIDPESVGSRLADGDLLVEYLVGDTELVIFAIRPDGLEAMVESIPRTNLRSRIELLRDLLSRPDSDRWEKPAIALADVLLKPLQTSGIVDGVDKIFIVPHDYLNYLPFAVLPVGNANKQKPMLDHFDLTYLATAAALGQPSNDLGDTASLLAVAPANSRLRYAPDEARSIQRIYEPNSTLLLGNAATESRFKSIASDYRILHIATHSDFNRLNPMFSGLQLESDDDNDGRLEVHEVLRLQLDADLVTLSACETGLGSGYFTDIPAGDEFVGLTRAFLSVGTDSVMATLWEVDDESSVHLMTSFYQGLEDSGRSKPQSLSIAQQRLRANKNYEHPYYWAPFVLVGQLAEAARNQETSL